MKDTLEIIRLLTQRYGTKPWNWHTQQAPFQVLIGTVLSQRTKDANTDAAARSLFSVYGTPKEIAGADAAEIERLIRKAGFYKTKAKRIKEIARIILEDYSGRVPDKTEELVKLPGVGRKTAGCVLVYGFKMPAIPVDTHVFRISNRIGLVRTRTPEETEAALMRIVPKEKWILINDLLVKHGQTVCVPRKPKCELCAISGHCDFFKHKKG